MTETEKQALLIGASKGAIDVLKSLPIDWKTRRAIQRLKVALAANGVVYKDNGR